MNLRDLKYLVTVAEIKHFGKAAELCHVSQPTLSMQLKKLEDTLGLQLFERSNRKVMLTKHGEQVVLEAKIALAACERMVQLARHAEDHDGHCLREQALEVCQRVGASESQSFRATSLETLRHMVAAGGTMTLMPKLATKQDRGIVYVPFAKPPWRRIALCWRKTSHQALLMKHFAELIQKIMK